MIHSGVDGKWLNKKRRHTKDGAPADSGGRMRMIRTGRGLSQTTIVGDVKQQRAVAQQEAKADSKQTNGEKLTIPNL